MEVFLQEDIRAKYASVWNDFVSIKINLLNGKLRELFENTLNVDKNKLNQFYKYFGCSRIFCVKLPNNGGGYNVPQLYDFAMWFELMEKFDGDNVTRTKNQLKMFGIGNLNHIYTFIVLWNGIFSMMYHRYGLVRAIKDTKFHGCVM